MDISKNENLRDALSRDLRPAGSKELVKVIDDAVRKVFTANKDGAVWVFGHKQPDAAYWNGVKHYGSGPSSRIRVRRTQTDIAEKPKAPAVAKRRSKKADNKTAVAHWLCASPDSHAGRAPAALLFCQRHLVRDDNTRSHHGIVAISWYRVPFISHAVPFCVSRM
jgi:hypothetical protein